MTIKDMHYDFKKKLNKIDSQQYRNLLIPEIDWTLNEAQEIFIKVVAFPRMRSYLGFEKSQRSIDDIRKVVVNGSYEEPTNNIYLLPSDYWHFIKGGVLISKGACSEKKGKFLLKQHDDEHEFSPFHNSSFEWREVNGVFYEGGIEFFTDGTFTVDKFKLDYVRRPVWMHNAEDFRNGTYKLPSGEILTGVQNCELPEHTHREIVDIGVLLATGQIQAPDFEIKNEKFNLNLK